MYKPTIMEKRVAQITKWLKEGYSRIEAVEKLAKKDDIKFNTAKMIVYTSFPGSKFSQRRRRWQRNPMNDVVVAPPPEIQVDSNDELDL